MFHKLFYDVQFICYVMHYFIKHCVLYPINGSNHELYLYCQSIPVPSSTQIFHLNDLFCSIYDLYWLLKHSFSIQYSKISFERDMLLYMYCVLIFFVNFLLRYQRIRVKEGNWLFSAFLRVWYVWNFESVYHLFIYFVHNSFSKMLIGFLFICLHIDLGIEKEGRGGIPRYIAYCFEIAVYFIFYVCSYNFLNS